ncbi:MAG: flavodoxin family protein [Anaerocolumna sp.]
MKVLLINGSPKVHGCTYTALGEIVKELKKANIDTEILHLGSKPIRGCMACGGCYNGSGKCIFNDDIVNVALGKAKEADGFIFGSPVHYAGASGQITSFLDRFFYAGDGYQYKPGAVVVSCRRGGSTAAFEQLNKYLTISSMPVVSSQYWNMVHGNTPDEVKQDLEGLQTMRTLGKNMACLLKSIQAGKEAGIPLPEEEERVGTNFIR